MSIGRKLLRKAAQTLGATLCIVALGACISPDLEPPGAMANTALPSSTAAATQQGANNPVITTEAPGEAERATAAAGAANPAGTASTSMGAKPATGTTVPPQTAPTTPPPASGAPGPGAEPNDSEEADAGTKTP